MKKLRFLGWLLMILGTTACTKDSDSNSVPTEPCGRFVHEGIPHELHYATRHGYLGVVNSMCIRLESADGKTRVDVSVTVRWDGSEKEQVQLTSGTYGMYGYTVEQNVDRITARIVLSDTPINPDWRVESTPKGDEVYDLRIYDPEQPESRYIVWSGKIARSDRLL